MIRVFSDFDGAVAKEDVGEQLFLNLTGGRSAEIVARYLSGQITSHERLRQECEVVGQVSRHRFTELLERFELDPFFVKFVQFCEQNGIDLTVVSDGLDFYVKHLLTREGLSQVPFFANHLEFAEQEYGALLVPSFPHRDAECPDCGNCKRNHVVTRSGDDDLIVYIGDGYSDRCPVKYADVVFAKRNFIKHCQRQNITYHEFLHFGDVQSRITEIARRPRIKKRREAVMARRELFMQG